MVPLILGMLLCVALALAVVGLVAIPARREGRDVLTPKGEAVVSRVREKTGTVVEKTGTVVETAREKTGETVGAARDKVAGVASRESD